MQKGKEYAILTDEITRAWAGMNTRQYKDLKGLKKENLRDNMSDLELVLTMLAEEGEEKTFAYVRRILKKGRRADRHSS